MKKQKLFLKEERKWKKYITRIKQKMTRRISRSNEGKNQKEILEELTDVLEKGGFDKKYF